jgi:hypothetical protein
MSLGKRNLRRHTRDTISEPLRILWEDADGREHVSQAKIVDISPDGIGLRSRSAIPLRSQIFCNDEKLGLRGRGTVRHCTYMEGKYQAGSGVQRWDWLGQISRELGVCVA